MALTIHYLPPTFERLEVPAESGIQSISHRVHSMITRNLADHEVASELIFLRVGQDGGDPGTTTEDTHVLVPMRTAAVPLLRGAQAEAVKAAWTPWWNMSERNREKVHERVMRVLREIDADDKIIRELQEVADNLKLELEECQRRRKERVEVIQERVQHIIAKLT